MKVIIIHDSHYGNGAKLAESMRASFEHSGATVSVHHVKEADAAKIVADRPQLCVVGAAIRAFQLSPTIKRLFAELRKATGKSGRIPHGVVFLTHALPDRLTKGWARRLRRAIEGSRAFEYVYPDWLSARVVGQEGPLEDGAIERFAGHARELLEWAEPAE